MEASSKSGKTEVDDGVRTGDYYLQGTMKEKDWDLRPIIMIETLDRQYDGTPGTGNCPPGKPIIPAKWIGIDYTLLFEPGTYSLTRYFNHISHLIISDQVDNSANNSYYARLARWLRPGDNTITLNLHEQYGDDRTVYAERTLDLTEPVWFDKRELNLQIYQSRLTLEVTVNVPFQVRGLWYWTSNPNFFKNYKGKVESKEDIAHLLSNLV